MRDDSISIAKGIAIILMVLAHTYFSQFGNQWINMFHMPLFFFFAGYCFKKKYIAQPKEFVFKRFIGLYKPFVKWSLTFLLLHNVFFYLNIYNGEYGFRGIVSNLYNCNDIVVHIFHIITRMTDNEQLLGGFWFLRSLLAGSIIGYLVIKKIHSKIYGGAILLILTVVLSLINKHVPYFELGARETFASLFFVSGHYYKELKWKIHEKKYILPLAIVLITIGVHFYQANLLNFEYWQVIPYLMTAIIGVLATYYLSRKISNQSDKIKSCLVYIGNNTLTILTWHMLSFKLVSLFIIYVYQLPIERLAEFPVIEQCSKEGWFVLYFFVGMLIPMGLSKCRHLK